MGTKRASLVRLAGTAILRAIRIHYPAIIIPLALLFLLGSPYRPVAWAVTASMAGLFTTIAIIARIDRVRQPANNVLDGELAIGAAVPTVMVVTVFASLIVQFSQDLALRSEGMRLSLQLAAFSESFSARTPALPWPPRTLDHNERFREERAFNGELNKLYQSEDTNYAREFGVRVHSFCDEIKVRRILWDDEVLGHICADPARYDFAHWHADEFAIAANRLPSPAGWFRQRWAGSATAASVISIAVLMLMQLALSRYRAQMIEMIEEARRRELA
jgi:hypothetical protein